MEQLRTAQQLLSRVGWLADVPTDFADHVLSRCKLTVLEKGSTLYRVGEPADGLYGLAKGTCVVEMAPNESGPIPLHIARPGTWFGEAAIFLTREPSRLVTVIATQTSSFLHLSNSEIENIAARDAKTWRWLGLLAAMHFREALGALDDLTLRRPRQRIAAILLRLANSRRVDNPLDPTPSIQLTQNDLAHLSNLSRAAIGAHLEDMRQDGLILCSYGQLTILDAARLRTWLKDEEESYS